MKMDKKRIRLWQSIGVVSIVAFIIIERHGVQNMLRIRARTLTDQEIDGLVREGHILIGVASAVLLFTLYLFYRELRERSTKSGGGRDVGQSR